MILAIQQASYLEARNPADMSTLLELAKEIGLDSARFSADMESPAVHEVLLKEIGFTRKLDVKGFPTLLLKRKVCIPRSSISTVMSWPYSIRSSVLVSKLLSTIFQFSTEY